MRSKQNVESEQGIIRKRLHRNSIITVPNILSFLRIALVPIIVILYIVAEEYRISAALIILSGATDVLDGWIARKFNCISDFGKFIDPVADKLTQCAVVLCLCTRYNWMILLLSLQILKEAILLTVGSILFKRKDTVNSARWYGKATTVLLYGIMVSLVLFPGIPENVAIIMAAVCGGAIATSLVLYLRFFILEIKR